MPTNLLSQFLPGDPALLPMTVVCCLMIVLVGATAFLYMRRAYVQEKHERASREAAARQVEALQREVAALEKARKELVDATEVARAAERAKGEFLANMSHEIRTPLNGILGMTTLLQESHLSDDQMEMLSLIKDAGKSLLSVVNDILDLSRVEAGKIELESIPFNLRDQLGDVARTLAIPAEDKGIELILDIAPDVPEMLVGDPVRLRQVMLNLIGNAVKFTDRGEICVKVRCGENLGGMLPLHFTVRDTGVGIPPERLDAVFDPFTQAERETTRMYGGSGLGLTISRRLIELAGGSIRVESTEGMGTTVHMILPFGEHANLSETESGGLLANLAGKQVFVVDDNEHSRRMMCEQLAAWGMNTTAMSSGEALMQEISTWTDGQEFPDVLVIDGGMPRFDGFTTAHHLRSMGCAMGRIILLIRQSHQPDEHARAEGLGVGVCLVKPIKPSELADGVVQVLCPDKERLVEMRKSTHSKQSVNPATILLAEDDLVNFRFAQMLLEQWGHAVVQASNGREVLEIVEQGKADLILMDVQMPVLDGVATTKILRKKEGPRIPIVAMTAYAMKGDRTRFLEAGMDEYVGKPIEADMLFEILERMLAGRETKRPSAQPKAKVAEFSPEEWIMDSLAGADGQDLGVRAALAAIWERFGTRKKTLQELAGLYVPGAEELLAAVDRAIAAGDDEALKEASHKMKGSASVFGSVAAVHSAARLELMARNKALTGGERELVESAAGTLRKDVGELVRALSTIKKPTN